MVVALLALLFVIVTGYLNLARFDRNTFELVNDSRQIDTVVDQTRQVVQALMRRQLADAQGQVLTGGLENALTGATVTKRVAPGYLDVDIPGYRGSHYLGATEPVVDVSLQGQIDLLGTDRVRWPAATSLTMPDLPYQPTLNSFLPWTDTNNNGVPDMAITQLSDTANAFVRFARNPVLDADGDGMPDASLPGSALATLLGNLLAEAGAPALTAMHPSADNPNDPTYLTQRRFDELARYEVAVRVVSHGGMISLNSPGVTNGDTAQLPNVWNRKFVTDLFNFFNEDTQNLSSTATLFGGDGGTPITTGPNRLNPVADKLFNEVAASATAIEPHLRRRGGTLAAWRPAFGGNVNNALADVPAVLRVLEDRFANTLISRFNTGLASTSTDMKSTDWQRFNLGAINTQPSAKGNEFQAWLRANFLNPRDVEGALTPATTAPRRWYDARHLMTALSTSDELARVQARTTTVSPAGLEPGMPKFFLGDIRNAFTVDSAGNSRFVENGQGRMVVERLVNYYYELLRGHDVDTPLTLDRLDQARMLAVNTVAFAAQRNMTAPPNAGHGFIDAVRYDPDLADPNSKVYTGYAPQPYFTQLVVHNESDASGDVAVVVELYNPNDALDPTNPNDPYALDLSQFAISLNGVDPNPQAGFIEGQDWTRLGTHPAGGTSGINFAQNGHPGLRVGRNYGVVVINPSGPFQEDTTQYPPHVAAPMTAATVDSTSTAVTAKLWRQGRDVISEWTLVDEISLVLPSAAGVDPDTDDSWTAEVTRDTSAETYFGDFNGLYAPRWAVAVGVSQPGAAPSPATILPTLGNSAPDPVERFAPTVLLYTMNAGAGPAATPINGSRRPASFPTPGFLLFVPRYSHVYDPAGLEPRLPASRLLKEAFESSGGGTPSVATTPADFGHMPIFDNNEGASPQVNGQPVSLFDDKRAGEIPWGQLVFDYFTTLNVNDPNFDGNTSDAMDPASIPGRININTAPWPVLAALPLINIRPNGQIDLSTAASPAFWRPQSGILTGLGSALNPTPRFVGLNAAGQLNTFTKDRPFLDGSSGVVRLGPDLALSIAGYRDRVPYTASSGIGMLTAGTSPFGRSYRRNDPNTISVTSGTTVLQVPAQPYRNESVYGEVRRGGSGVPATPMQFGFLTVGELANVMGMDSSNFYDASGAPLFTPSESTLSPSIGSPDFMKAVSLLALLDTQYLTTRSHTFTVYVSVMDRENPQESVRAQFTVDRSNILPRAVEVNGNIVTVPGEQSPRVLAEQRVGYFNARYDH